MFFRTRAECLELARALGYREGEIDGDRPERFRTSSITASYESSPRASVVLARHVVSWLGDVPLSLLWITEWGVWPSENLHLYYRLRASYGDHRALIDAPGHEFLDYEKADLVTFLELAIQFSWGGHLLYAPKWTRVFFSHDGWIRIWAETARDQILRDLENLELPYQIDTETGSAGPEGSA